jgi:hypothetical protein
MVAKYGKIKKIDSKNLVSLKQTRHQYHQIEELNSTCKRRYEKENLKGNTPLSVFFSSSLKRQQTHVIFMFQKCCREKENSIDTRTSTCVLHKETPLVHEFPPEGNSACLPQTFSMKLTLYACKFTSSFKATKLHWRLQIMNTL